MLSTSGVLESETTMGLIRKVSSISTLRAVKFTSKREAETKAAQEQAKLYRAEHTGS